MTRRRFAVVFLFIAVLHAVPVHAQPRGAVDWIFLVDTSKSMRSENIFDNVKESLRTFVREASHGDTVSVYTFDRGVRLHSSGDIPSRRDDLNAVIDGLEANGNRTHLGLAIQEGLKRAESLRANADSTRRRALVLFTDGKQDVRGIENPVEISSNLNHVGAAHIFFISLNEHEEKLDLFETATILKPTPEAIRNLAQQIRATLPPPPPPPTTVDPPKSLPPSPPPPPEPEGFPLWPIPIAIVAVAAAVFTFLRHRRRNRLEGEIEILEPRAASAFVGLPKLEANEVALSSIVPPDALAGSDARLFVRRRNGTKQICISVQTGSLRINDVETPLTELYDSDTIRIGDATLRFNRAGYHKPQEEL